MAELVDGCSGGQAGLVHEGGHGLAEGVGGDPVEAGVSMASPTFTGSSSSPMS